MKHWGNSRSQSQESGWTLSWVSALDRNARTIWIADAHRDGKRFVVRARMKSWLRFWNSKESCANHCAF